MYYYYYIIYIKNLRNKNVWDIRIYFREYLLNYMYSYFLKF